MVEKFVSVLVIVSVSLGVASILISNLLRTIDSTLAINKAEYFSKNVSEHQEEVSKFSIIATGDVMLGRAVMANALRQNDPYYPFRNVFDFLKTADLTVINLENPIVENCPLTESGFKFCTSYEIAEGLIYSGVDVVNLSNNHSANYGRTGLDETKSWLAENGILAVGSEELVVKEVDGIKFGFLGFDFTLNAPTESDYELIRVSGRTVDHMFVNVHWGQEYKNSANANQRDWGRKMLENGADIIIGHHPHWVQDAQCFFPHREWNGFTHRENIEAFGLNGEEVSMEISSKELFKGQSCPPGTKSIYYSLGNFIFDQMWSEETKKGAALRFEFYGKELAGTEVVPIYIKNTGQPEFIGN